MRVLVVEVVGDGGSARSRRFLQKQKNRFVWCLCEWQNAQRSSGTKEGKIFFG